jgi:MFS transporter, DHA3 family, macrolide efflux protein
MPDGETRQGWQLLKTRNFSLLWWGQLISQVGDSLNKVALLWFVYSLTGSAMKMTMVGLLQTVPPLLFGPLMGVYLDRFPRKPVLIAVDLLRTVMVVLIPVLYAFDALTLDRLYVLVFLNAIVSTIFGPALASTVPLIVPAAQLTSANALLQSTSNIGLLVGPALSGLGIALIGAQNVLYVDAATFLISAICLIPLRVPEEMFVPRQDQTPGFVPELLAGFRFVFMEHRTIFILMAIGTLYSLGTSALVFLLPILAKESLQVGPMELGGLWSALGIGMLIASAWLASINQGDLCSRLKLMAVSMVIGASAVLGLSLFHTPVLAAMMILMIGGSTAVFTPIVWSVLQELTPQHLLGRVFTTFSTGGMSSAMAGMAGVGWAADTIGLSGALLGIAIALLATAVLAALSSRRGVAVRA